MRRSDGVWGFQVCLKRKVLGCRVQSLGPSILPRSGFLLLILRDLVVGGEYGGCGVGEPMMYARSISASWGMGFRQILLYMFVQYVVV